MTNQEAIAILKEAKLKFLDNQFIALEGYEIEAMTLAINALEREVRQPHNYKRFT